MRDIEGSAARLLAFFARPPSDGVHHLECGSAMATFRGKRTANQDRGFVAFIPRHGSEQAVFVAAVLDGMGGMENGAKASSIAASVFTQSLARGSGADLASRLLRAIRDANAAVWTTMQGRGGTTLTAVAMTQCGECRVVHIGDSRLYRAGTALCPVTSDDTLGGLFGIDDLGPLSSGLMQFVGIGKGMMYQAFALTSDLSETLLLTTDGFHSASDLTSIVSESGDFGFFEVLKYSARRLSVDDNATAVTVDRRQVESVLAMRRRGLVVITAGQRCVL